MSSCVNVNPSIKYLPKIGLSDHVMRCVSETLGTVIAAFSKKPGRDAVLYSQIACRFLRNIGVSAQPVAGVASWRVGIGDFDVITHENPLGINPLNYHYYHAWLEVDDLLVDFSTLYLQLKADDLDSMDGKVTTVSWCPPYLVAPRLMNVTSQDVIDSFDVGVFNYRRIEEFEKVLFSFTPDALEEYDFLTKISLRNFFARLNGIETNDLIVTEDGTLRSIEEHSYSMLIKSY